MRKPTYEWLSKSKLERRQQIYASINGRKGNLITLSKCKLIKKDELEKLNKVIEALEELRICMRDNGIYVKN